MWKEVFESEMGVFDQRNSSHFADDVESIPSRRVSAASDDSFDASSYVHVDSKLNSKMPKCLLSDDKHDKNVENHFEKSKTESNGPDVTKTGKKVIRKRLSVSEFNASRLRAKNNSNNNSNAISNRLSAKDLSNSSSSDNDTLPKTKKRNKDVLSAKIQHLLFEMKRLRQLDKDILRQFLIINDTIEEQRWMFEEKQEAIKRSLSEEGEDPMNFDIVPEEVENQEEDDDDDDESIQSVLSRQNSNMDEFNDTLPADEVPVITETKKLTCKDSDLVSTSSDSALSMSGASSTLSSTTSLTVSNRSSSPPTSNLSTTSASSSYIDSMEKKVKAKEIISSARTEPIYSTQPDYERDIEGYYRMHGSSMKRGSYPFPRQTKSFDAGHVKPHFDDTALDSAYSTRRGSTDSDSRDAAEHAMAVRRAIVNRGYAQQKPRPRSGSASSESMDSRNRVTRISVRPDGTTADSGRASNPPKRTYSLNDKTSAAYRLLQHPAHQRHLARMNVNRKVAHMSFVPIAEQEPDVMVENGRLYSNDSDSKFDTGHREYQNLIDLSRQRQNQNATRQCPPVARKPSAAGSAGSLTSSSSRTSSSSLGSSCSNSSAHSPTKYTTNEADQYRARPTKEPIWVQRRPQSARYNDYIAIPHNKAFPAPYSHRYPQQGVKNFQNPEKSRAKLSKRASLPQPPTGYVSCKPVKGANQAVYNWIQTQDDITYL